MEKVRIIGDPILAQHCTEIDPTLVDQEDLKRLLLTMAEVMRAENGAGLAANQVGRTCRLFILKNDDGSASEYINPYITSYQHPVPFEEGCLSIPGVSAVTTRYNEVLLSWIDRHGLGHRELFTGFKAFAIQHEMDHLNGKLYIDQFGPIKRKLILKKYKKALKKSRR